MSAEAEGFDLARDVPTTPEDVAALRRLRADRPGWFSLTPDELLALLPATRWTAAPTPAGARPFVLDGPTLSRSPRHALAFALVRLHRQ